MTGPLRPYNASDTSTIVIAQRITRPKVPAITDKFQSAVQYADIPSPVWLHQAFNCMPTLHNAASHKSDSIDYNTNCY